MSHVAIFNRKLETADVDQIYNNGQPYSDLATIADCRGCWKFDSSSVWDISYPFGTGNWLIPDARSESSSSLYFNGSQYAKNSFVPSTNEVSVSFWIYRESGAFIDAISQAQEDLDFAETMMEMNIAEIEDLQTEGLSSTAALNKIAEAKNAISLGLMKNVLKNKSANEVAAIQSQYNIGTTNDVSSKKTKAYVELIKEKFGVRKDVTQIISQTFSDQNSREAKKAFIKNQTDKLDNENYLEQKKSIASEKAGQLFTSHIQNKGIELGKLDLSNSENQNKVIEIFNLINSTKDIGEKQNIQGFGAVLATEKELMFNKTRFIDNLINKRFIYKIFSNK